MGLNVVDLVFVLFKEAGLDLVRFGFFHPILCLIRIADVLDFRVFCVNVPPVSRIVPNLGGLVQYAMFLDHVLSALCLLDTSKEKN